METIRVEFYVSTSFVGSTIKDVVEFEITGDETDEELSDMIAKEFEEWVWDRIDADWRIIEGVKKHENNS